MPSSQDNLSVTAISLVTLLNNIDELIVKSNNRQDAKDVMRAFRTYAKNHNFTIPEDKVDNFHAVLLDSRPYTLSSIIHDIAADVIKIDRSS